MAAADKKPNLTEVEKILRRIQHHAKFMSSEDADVMPYDMRLIAEDAAKAIKVLQS